MTIGSVGRAVKAGLVQIDDPDTAGRAYDEIASVRIGKASSKFRQL